MASLTIRLVPSRSAPRERKSSASSIEEIPPAAFTLTAGMQCSRIRRTSSLVAPQVEKPVETSIEPLNVETFRVPGASIGAGTGKVTTIDGVDPDGASVTGMGGGPKKEEKSEDKRLDFCVLSVHKSELEKDK